MQIEFNKVTWYSKLISAIILLGVFPMVVFYIGVQYENTIATIILEKNENLSVKIQNNTPKSLLEVKKFSCLEESNISSYLLINELGQIQLLGYDKPKTNIEELGKLFKDNKNYLEDGQDEAFPINMESYLFSVKCDDSTGKIKINTQYMAFRDGVRSFTLIYKAGKLKALKYYADQGQAYAALRGE